MTRRMSVENNKKNYFNTPSYHNSIGGWLSVLYG